MEIESGPPPSTKGPGPAKTSTSRSFVLAVTAAVVFAALSGVFIFLYLDKDSSDAGSSAGGDNDQQGLGSDDTGAWRVCFHELESMSVNQTDITFNSVAQVAFPQYNLPGDVPAFVAKPRTALEVRDALACAAANNIPVAVKNGGHNYAGYSQTAAPGFVIALRPFMHEMQIETYDGQLALRVQAGAIFEQVYSFINRTTNTHVLAGGLCPSVGIAGFHLGGGLGAVCRQYGLGVDNMLEVQMVTADGSQIVRANRTQNQDLFWALRGGGGPSFGIVTEFVIRLHPAEPLYTYAELCYGDNPVVMKQYLMAIANRTSNGNDFPDWLALHYRLVKRTNGFTGLCPLIYSHRGKAETVAALHGLITSASDPNIHFMHEFTSYFDMDLANAEYKGYTEFFVNPPVNKNHMLPALTEGLIDVLIDLYETAMPDPNTGGPSCYMQGMSMGGALIHSIPRNATAFPFRERVSYAADSECEVEEQEQEGIVDAFLSTYITRTQPWSLGAYLNFPYRDVADYEVAYWAENIGRLRQVKSSWNPGQSNVLDFPQAVRD